VRRSWVVLAVVLLIAPTACTRTVQPATTGSTGSTVPVPPAGGAAVTAGQVLARPWPARVTPTAAWAATVAGTGARVSLTTVDGVTPGALGQATFTLASADPRPSGATTVPAANNVHLALPDGSAWYPLGPFHLDTTGDLPFTTAVANDAGVTLVVPSLAAVLAKAPDPVVAVGRFVTADGRQLDRLSLPRATKVVRACPSTASTPCPASTDPPAVALAAGAGTVLRGSTGSQSGEAAVAGVAHAEALGHQWDGLVGAAEGTGLAATATWDGRTWSMTATVSRARQLWVDVWPVADTTLAATSGINSNVHNCLRNCDLRLRWLNTGFATSQIYEAEGLGPDGHSIGFDLNKSLGHDAGLGVGRGDRKINLGGGGDVDSNQPPGAKVDRGLSYTPGADVTLVLRGNFPDVRVHLAIPAA
jgi:hypothetical protein